MYDLRKYIFAREEFLSKVIKTKKKSLMEAPEGALRTSTNRKRPYYYYVTEDSGKDGKYLKKSQKPLIHALAQKEYDQKVLKAAETEEKLLKKLNLFYQSGRMAEEQFLNEVKARQSLIDPIEMTDEQFVEKWLSVPYEGLEFHEKLTGCFSDNNEQMRSKSEVIIANMLKKHGVPYRYECPLRMDGRSVYPDFTVLNVRKRKEIYWEHLGLLDDPEYQEKNLAKLIRYEMNGLFPGEDLIITFETARQPLNMRLLEKVIEKYCD